VLERLVHRCDPLSHLPSSDKAFDDGEGEHHIAEDKPGLSKLIERISDAPKPADGITPLDLQRTLKTPPAQLVDSQPVLGRFVQQHRHGALRHRQIAEEERSRENRVRQRTAQR